MEIKMSLYYHGVCDAEAGQVYLLKEEGSGLFVEVPRSLLPEALYSSAEAFRGETMGGEIPLTLTLSWPG